MLKNEIILYLQNHFNPEKKIFEKMFEKLDMLFKIILTSNKLKFKMLTGNSPIHSNFDCAK